MRILWRVLAAVALVAAACTTVNVITGSGKIETTREAGNIDLKRGDKAKDDKP